MAQITFITDYLFKDFCINNILERLRQYLFLEQKKADMLTVQHKRFGYPNFRVSLPQHNPLHVQLSIWAHLCRPVGNGPRETGAHSDSLATAIAECNRISCL